MNGSVVRNQSGVGLIEVLVTLLVLSSSLMALAALQTRSLSFNQGAYIRSQANIAAYDILDRVRINSTRLNEYNVVADVFDKNSAVVTAPASAADMDSWRRALAISVPSAQAALACDAVTRVCTVTITWGDNFDQLLDTAGNEIVESSNTFTYAARL